MENKIYRHSSKKIVPTIILFLKISENIMKDLVLSDQETTIIILIRWLSKIL